MKFYFVALLLAFSFGRCTTQVSPATNSGCDELLQMFKVSSTCQNRYFPSRNKPMPNEIVVFLSKGSCPSCIVEVHDYINTIKVRRNLDVKFFADNKSEYPGLNTAIPTLQSIEVDSIFSSLNYPVLFETNQSGRIINCLPLHSSYLDLSFKYLTNYADIHQLDVLKP